MTRTRIRSFVVYRILLTGLLLTGGTLATSAQETFHPLFDGETLEGWKAGDERYWSVVDGAITAASTDELPCTKNQFLVWERGEVDDFELRFRFRIDGHASANSGVQFRSTMQENGQAIGYQADIDLGKQWLGALYDEHTGRRVLAKRGEKTLIAPDGKRQSSSLDLGDWKFEPARWNDYRIVARGDEIRLEVNGVLTAQVVDGETAHHDHVGRLALQLHSGPSMRVQFKDIELARLPLSDGRRKAVLVAGAPSHASGEHEFNAGIRLLAKRLREVPKLVVAEYHDRGYPKDPSAFDNANSIVVYADGQGRHPLVRHMEAIDALMARGVSLMCMHYAVHVAPGPEGKAFQRWIGGFYETDFSSNPHWDADLKVNEKHPVCRGVAPRVIHDEWYFSIRFRDDAKSVTTLLEAKPSDKTRSVNNWPRKTYPHIVAQSGRSETLMWAVERPDGGRGVGFTGGHWHRNWAYEEQRKAVLNAIVWISGLAVPKQGVVSEPVSVEELNANLDKKQKMKRVGLPSGVGVQKAAPEKAKQ